MKTYIATGLVYGELWQPGEEGSYPARKLANDDRDVLLAEAEAMLADKSLDSGMGYARLLGALLLVEEIETITVEEKEYQRSEVELVFLGDLSENQREFLEEHIWQ